MWVDLETYAWPDKPCASAPGGSRPAPIARVGDQVARIGRWVGGFSQWLHGHDFRAGGLGNDACDPARAALGRAYDARPFPFTGFVYNKRAIIRGYRLLPSGTLRVRCNTASGARQFDFNAKNGLAVHYAPSWVPTTVVPDPREIVEATAPMPSACTGKLSAIFISPGGAASSGVPL